MESYQKRQTIMATQTLIPPVGPARPLTPETEQLIQTRVDALIAEQVA
jgi:hypothetical protein